MEQNHRGCAFELEDLTKDHNLAMSENFFERRFSPSSLG